MKRKTKILLITVSVLLIAFFAVRYYIFYGGKRDIQSESTAFTVTAANIANEFAADVDKSNKKYLEKPVAVTGTITSVEGTSVILDQLVNCNFTATKTTFKVGQKVTVKGRVVGFDDLLGEVKMDQCNLITN
ncbi:OB-fold protein [Flavobacterium sp. TBRC 19031]|uniref:OB-fold protein n=1 Tax=Flavobacterium mekongense TaxID=3379707 RepID=UPI00399B5179